MSRRTLDLILSGGGVLFAVLFVVLGVVMRNEATFAKDYVHDQLGQQKITFTAADKLTAEEKSWKPGSSCLTDNAGQLMQTGKQAECYANNFIGLHLKGIANGQTYADLGNVQGQLRTQIATAQQNNDPNLKALQDQLVSVTAQRETVFKGETLRGLLLTSFGFSEFGHKAGQAALVAYIAAAVMLLLALAGFVHAIRTPATEPFAAVESKQAKLATA